MKPSGLFGALLLACALPLGGCSTITSMISTVTTATVTQKTAAATVASINAAEQLAVAYLTLPTCAAGQTPLKNACKSTASIPTVSSAANAAMAAKKSLLAALTTAQAAGSSVGVASTAFNAATSALTSLSGAVNTAKSSN